MSSTSLRQLHGTRGLLVVASLVAGLTLDGTGGEARAQQTGSAGFTPRRIVHRFDFDERALGNLEDLPKFWEQLTPRGFPHYARGGFDFTVGRTAPPSFHLASEGRNVAFHYAGPDTRIRGNTEYRVAAYIRPDRLVHARACLSAYAVDRRGRPIPGTLVRSRYVGGSADAQRWAKVELVLPPAPPEAHTLGLAVWVMQESTWDTSPPPRRHIRRNDVRGGAWVDDVTIFALPLVQITTGSPGNVLVPEGPRQLRALLADQEDPTLRGVLSIFAAEGDVVETHQVPVMLDESADPKLISVDHLAPGLYRAELAVFARDAQIVSRTLRFATLGPRLRRSGAAAKAFGVVVDPRSRSDSETELAMLEHLGVRSAKLPVWTGLADQDRSPRARRDRDRLLQGLIRRSFVLTGVFLGPPSAIVRTDGAYVRPLIELLASDPGMWREHLAAVVAPYANAFRWWQVGSDRDTPTAQADQFAQAFSQLRDTLSYFITHPSLTTSLATDIELPTETLPVEQLTLAISSDVPIELFQQKIASVRKLNHGEVSAYIEPLPADRFRRLPRLADWTQRVVAARHAGASTVFVPQMWTTRETPQGLVTEPDETYLVLRTIADVLGDAVPGPTLRVQGNVHCLAFYDDDSSILALWDPGAAKSGSRVRLQLGTATRWIDVWGRSHPLGRDGDGRHILPLSAVPVFVPQVPRWLVEFRASVALNPPHLDSGGELARLTLEMRYRGDRPVSGTLRFVVADEWRLVPRGFHFNVMPQRVGRWPVEVHYAHTEPAGLKEIRAEITLESPPYYMEVPLSVEIGLTDLEAWGMAVVDGHDLLLRHTVANRSSETLSFRASATVPGRERQYRPIANLQPGDIQTVVYRFSGGTGVIGRNVRLGLRELNDGPRIHNLELTVP